MDILKEALKNQEIKKFCKDLTAKQIEQSQFVLFQQALASKKCQECQGKKACESDVNNMMSNLVNVNGIVSRQYYYCTYQEQTPLIDFTYYSQYQPNSKDEIFPNQARNNFFVTLNEIYNTPKGIYLWGAFGCGKSFLMMQVANKYAKEGKKVIFAYYPDLIMKVKAAINEGNVDKVIIELKKVDVLIIDDIGSEMNTAFVRDEFLGPLLQYRMSMGLPVFMTSNYDIKSLGEHFAVTKDESSRLKADRIIQRITCLMKVIKLEDKNYRQ